MRLVLPFAAGLWALEVTGAAVPAPKSFLTARDQKAFSFPLPNGFPDIKPGSDALKAIEKQARGTLPDGALPKEISDISATVWQLIAFNELFEVAYFHNLIQNVSNHVAGYEIGTPAALNVITNALEAVEAQEQLHALGANGILQSAGRKPISPCKYMFPVEDFDEAISFASTFTDIVLGTLQEALTNFGLDGDGLNFIGLVGSVIGQEGEQNGFYRALGQTTTLVPSSQPFLTASTGVFALSALHQMVVIPGSCPDTLPIPILGALNVETTGINAQTNAVQFSFYTNDTNVKTDDLSLVYINAQNVPKVEKLRNVQIKNNYVSFDATFPYQRYQMDGLTIAAVTHSAGPFANATEVAQAALYGPGIIEV